MRKPRIPASQFNEFFPLLYEKPWLEDRFEEMMELTNLCSYEAQRSLIYTLLARFNYLDDSRLNLVLRRIIKQVFDVWLLPRGQTQIVAVTLDESADGAQAVLYDLKGLLAAEGIGPKDVKLVNRVEEARENLYKCPNVVLIDDFVGSGQTMRSRVQHLRVEFDNKIRKKGIPVTYTINICAVACMEAAQAEIQALNVPFFAGVSLLKGIAGYVSGKALRRAYRDMLRLEARINDDSAAKEFPFGFNRAEALFCLKASKNVPNSVFPVFWWPKHLSGRKRTTMFDRFERT
jgi:hypothetical protein